MKRLLTAVLTTATLAASLLVGAQPASATAVSSISSITLSSPVAVVNGDAGCARRIHLTVRVVDPHRDSLGGHVELSSPAYGVADYEIFNSSRSGSTTTYATWLWLCGHSHPGRYTLHILIYGLTHDLTSDARHAWIKRPTSLTYDASPEPARRGAYLTHTGRLLFDPFAPGPAYGPRGVTLQLAFRAAGTSAYVAKGTITTTSGGYYAARARTSASGTWRLTYGPTTYRQTQRRYDNVAVS